jgi:hypothetical protein
MFERRGNAGPPAHPLDVIHRQVAMIAVNARRVVLLTTAGRVVLRTKVAHGW